MQKEKVFLKLSEVIKRTGKSRSAIYLGMKAGTFPSSVPIGARAVAWVSSDIDAWQDSCIAAAVN